MALLPFEVFDMSEESACWFGGHPFFSFFEEFKVFIPGRVYPAAPCETTDPSVGLSASECFPGQCRLKVDKVIFQLATAMRLPLLRFSLYSTYQPWKARPDLSIRPPVLTRNRLERFRLQGFFVPS